jgi:CTP:molybdopterin cytidylyltransferase MocA
MAEPAPLPALILAAGLGVRYRAEGGSGPKVLAELAGRPLLAHVADVATAAGLSPTLVVVAPELASADGATGLEEPDLQLVVNPHPERGLGPSLRMGLAALADGAADACVVLLGDQPGIDPAVVRDVVAAWRRTGRPARARYLDGAGHPVLLPRATWPTLGSSGATAGDAGARDLLAGLDVLEVEVARHAPMDVDTPADLARIDGGAQR